MNITQSSKGDQLVSIKINVVKDDYEPKVNESLKKIQHTANMPGFRPGKVPFNMIKRLYGTSTKMEVLNDIVSESLNKHIFDNKLDLLGYPLSDLEQQKPADLEHEDDLEFCFEAALRPEVKIELEKIKMDAAKIVATDKDIDGTIDNIIERNPNIIHPEAVGESDKLELKIAEAENGKEVEDGFKKGIYFHMDQVKEKKSKDLLLGKKVGEEFIFNFAKAMKSEDAAAKVLGEDAPADSDFNIIIDDITREEKPELNEELFEKIFPGKEVKDLDTFKSLVKEEMEKQYTAETDQYLFSKMIEKLIDEVKFDLPDAFLKRWIVENSQGKITTEEVEANYDNDYAKGLRWQIIEDAIVKENTDLVIQDDELHQFILKQIFPGIDYATLDDDMKGRLDGIAKNMMKNEEQVNQAKNQLADIKMTQFLKNKMKIKFKETSYEGFIESLKKGNETKKDAKGTKETKEVKETKKTNKK